METKIPQTKQEAFAQLDEMMSEKDKNDLIKGDAIEFIRQSEDTINDFIQLEIGT